MHYLVEFDVAEMLKRSYSSLHARNLLLTKGADRFIDVRLHLHSSDSNNERLNARSDVVITQLEHLASKEAGQIVRAD